MATAGSCARALCSPISIAAPVTPSPRARFSAISTCARVSPAATGNSGLTFRVSDVHLGDDAYRGYYLGLSAQNDQVILGRVSENLNEIKTATLAVEAGKSVEMRIEARGAQIRVWVGASRNQRRHFCRGALSARAITPRCQANPHRVFGYRGGRDLRACWQRLEEGASPALFSWRIFCGHNL